MKRRAISTRTKLASALLALGHVPYGHAKQMSEVQLISLYQFDHGILHAIQPIDLFWNLQPKLRAEHREKSRRDTAIVAKTKRIAQDHAQHTARMRELGKAGADRFVGNHATLRVFRAKRKWPSRSFPRGRKLRPNPTQREE
jgi:hypothetical protein